MLPKMTSTWPSPEVQELSALFSQGPPSQRRMNSYMKAGATAERPVEAIAEETAVKTAKKDQLLVQYALDDFITNGAASSEQNGAALSSPTSPPVPSPTPSTLEEELALETLMKNWRMAEVRLLQADRQKKEEEAVLDTKKRLRAYRRARELRLAKDWLQETPTPAAFIRGRGGFDPDRLHDRLSPGKSQQQHEQKGVRDAHQAVQTPSRSATTRRSITTADREPSSRQQHRSPIPPALERDLETNRLRSGSKPTRLPMPDEVLAYREAFRKAYRV